MEFIDTIKARARADRKRIVLPETEDDRALRAAAAVIGEGTADLILIGDPAQVRSDASRLGISVEGAKIVDPQRFERLDDYAAAFAALRAKTGMTVQAAREALLTDRTTFGVMLVKMGEADGLVSGLCHSSANTLRPALQIIRTAPGRGVASVPVLFEIPDCEYGENGVLLCADCALMQDPDPEQLAEIGAESAETFRTLVGTEPRVAFLCHSTRGSAKHPFVDKVVEAVRVAKERYPEELMDGELQLDAALVPEIAAAKAPDSPVAGRANVLIFPNLEAGNIGYKLIERLAKAQAYSFIQGLAAPVNDVSRGCSWQELTGIVAITVVQAQNI